MLLVQKFGGTSVADADAIGARKRLSAVTTISSTAGAFYPGVSTLATPLRSRTLSSYLGDL